MARPDAVWQTPNSDRYNSGATESPDEMSDLTVKDMRAGLDYPAPGASPEDVALIQKTVDHILLSAPFRATRQCQDLLRYVVENTLAGSDHLLRERIIGVEVFGRRPEYDTSEDPVVRLRAAEVRKRLAQYYQSTEASAGPRIQIPPGSYRATFTWAPLAEPETPPPTHEAAPSLSLASAGPPLSSAAPVVPRSSRPWRWFLLAGFFLLVCAAVFARVRANSPEAILRQFWGPILDGPKPVLICMGTNAVYRFSNRLMVQYLKEHPLEHHDGLDFYAQLPPDQLIESRDVQKAYNSFVALGDVAAASDVVATLTRRGKPFQERFPPDVSFAELQDVPTVAIGGFNNPLTLTLSKDLRYFLVDGNRVVDRNEPARSWVVSVNGDSHETEDYGVISRLVHSKTGGPALTVAGIGQYGTQAAAEFVSSPEALAALIKTAPRQWSSGNVQVVVHVHVVNFRPITTEVVAAHFW